MENLNDNNILNIVSYTLKKLKKTGCRLATLILKNIICIDTYFAGQRVKFVIPSNLNDNWLLYKYFVLCF